MVDCSISVFQSNLCVDCSVKLKNNLYFKLILLPWNCRLSKKQIGIFSSLSILVVVLFFLDYTGTMSQNSKLPDVNNKLSMHLIVIPYFSPNHPDWEIIFDEAEKHPGVIRYIVINPCSGPCQHPLSEDWQEIIAKSKSRGIKPLGYVFDNAQTFDNVDYYMKDPKIKTSGMFFDNEGSTNRLVDFKKYSDYVRSLDGIVYINPGYNYNHLSLYSQQNVFDVINLYEFGLENIEHVTIPDYIQNNKTSVILGNAKLDDLANILEEMNNHDIRTIYIYNDTYQSIPDFFSELVTLLSN